MQSEDFREPNTEEIELFKHLLAPEFPGRDQLVKQVNDCLVKTVVPNEWLEIQVNSSVKATKVKYCPPTEGEVKDIDGITIHILLHVKKEKLWVLETYKEDGSRVISLPPVSEIRVFAPEQGITRE